MGWVFHPIFQLGREAEAKVGQIHAEEGGNGGGIHSYLWSAIQVGTSYFILGLLLPCDPLSLLTEQGQDSPGTLAVS